MYKIISRHLLEIKEENLAHVVSCLIPTDFPLSYLADNFTREDCIAIHVDRLSGLDGAALAQEIKDVFIKKDNAKPFIWEVFG